MWRWLALAVGMAGIVTAQAKELGVAPLLVASRDLSDPNFAKTVILVVHHDADGVVGLVLNRRTDVPLSKVFDGMETAKGRTDPVFLGGPVDGAAVFALARSTFKVEGAEHVFGDVYLIATKSVLEQAIAEKPDKDNFHVFMGYAGWTHDQLHKEVELGAWSILEADIGSVFDSNPESLWLRMIRKTEQKRAQTQKHTTYDNIPVVCHLLLSGVDR
jgi:putative transcriptional regulator